MICLAIYLELNWKEFIHGFSRVLWHPGGAWLGAPHHLPKPLTLSRGVTKILQIYQNRFITRIYF